MKQSIRITSRVNKRLYADAIPGHFATNHSHINYYIDMSEIKHRMAMSREAARSIAYQFSSTSIDTLLCMEGTEYIGAYLAGELRHMIEHRNVLVLVNSASTGQTFSQAKECVEYYGGRVSGFAALFSNISELSGKKVVSLFSGADFPHYQNFVRGKACPDCAAGTPLDAIVTPRGYNKL